MLKFYSDIAFERGVVWWCYGIMVLWCYGIMVLWYYGVMVLWYYGVMVLWYYGVMVLWVLAPDRLVSPMIGLSPP